MFRKITTIAAAIATTATLAATASPAGAIYRDYEPTDAEEPAIERTAHSDDTTSQKGCSVNLQNPDGSPGQTVVYEHGYSFSVKNQATGKTHTFTCNNGKWEETVNFTTNTGGYTFEAEEAYTYDLSTKLALVDAEYTYSSGDGYYAQP